VFYIHVANGIPDGGASKKAVAAVNHAITRGVADMEKAHRDWWHAFYPASFVTVPDARIESFYWIQWYKLGSAMREDGPMVDLMGPWFKVRLSVAATSVCCIALTDTSNTSAYGFESMVM
jgi:hypothetical protein